MKKLKDFLCIFIFIFLLMIFIYILLKGLTYFIQLKPDGDARLVMYNLDKKENKIFLLRLLINNTFFR
ncbi:MAG: hypothetical protein JG776_70 [Caloramator sp.]|jgi:hypothetical protein|nr:hypothetical protein [Caloramator sp.]